MAIQSLLPFCPLQNPANTEYGISLLGTAGLYALSGVLLGVAPPLGAALFAVVSTLGTRTIHYALNKWFEPASIPQKIACFVTAFFAGSLISAFLTNAVGLSMSFAVGMLLHAAALSTVLTVICVALPCVLCLGAAIGVRLLPE